MAAAIVPMVLNALPEVINLIAGLVHRTAPVVEQQLGPKTGPVKFAAVFASVMDGLSKAAQAGQIDKKLPDDEVVKVIINSAIASMQLSGALDGGSAVTAAALSPQSLVVSSGQSITITIAVK